MSVRLIRSNISDYEWIRPGVTATTITLFGKPFPPDDVKAYWGLVPVEIAVVWSPALSMFFVTNVMDSVLQAARVLGGEEAQPIVRRQIMATDAHKLSVWMETIAALVNGAP